MAGQPQEPTWQPPDQARAAWQQPSYSPSAGGPQDNTYAYGQQPGQGYPPPGYAPQDQPGYGPQDHGQDARWQAMAGMNAAGQPRKGKAARAPGEKGFVSSLFDFSFTSLITPKIIKALYGLFTAWTVLWALIFIVQGFHYGHMIGGLFVLVIVVPIFMLVTMGAFRVLLEGFMVLHRIYQELKSMRAGGEHLQG